MTKELLIIISCGRLQDTSFPAKAKDAYSSNYFKINRRYAEMFSDRWMILSTKYGLVDPEYIYDKPYNYLEFRISDERMKEQIRKNNLDSFARYEVLGGRKYVEKIQALFPGKAIEDYLVGRKIEDKILLTKKAIEENKHLSKPLGTTSHPKLRYIDWDLTYKVKKANNGNFYGPFGVDNQNCLWIRDPDFSTPKNELLTSPGWRLVNEKEFDRMSSDIQYVVNQHTKTKGYQKTFS